MTTDYEEMTTDYDYIGEGMTTNEATTETRMTTNEATTETRMTTNEATAETRMVTNEATTMTTDYEEMTTDYDYIGEGMTTNEATTETRMTTNEATTMTTDYEETTTDYDYLGEGMTTNAAVQPTGDSGGGKKKRMAGGEIPQCVEKTEAQYNDSFVSYLTVATNRLTDSTTVSCFSGGANDTVNLTISRVPYFTVIPPGNITIVAGGNLSLECWAVGDDPLSISWRRENITLSIGPYLRMVGVALDDEGDYHCQANGSGLVNQTTTRIIVTTQATILEGPGEFSVTEWTPLVLTCLASGRPLPTLSWSGVEGAQEDSTGDDTVMSTLSLIGLPPGLFPITCQADNNVGEPASSFGIISVESVVPTLLFESPIMEGSVLLLECVSEGSESTFSWLKDGSSLDIENTEYETSIIGSSAQLRVSNVVPGVHDGEYTCRLDNYLANGTRPTATVAIAIIGVDNCVSQPCANGGACSDRVGGFSCNCTADWTGPNCTDPITTGERPVITQPPADHRDLPLFGEVVLTCEASGSPQLFTWYRDDKVVVTTSTGQLVLRAITPADRGRYTCRAENSIGPSLNSAAGLLTIRGVLQYLVTIADCSPEEMSQVLLLIQDLLVGELVRETDVTIYSVTRLAVPEGVPPADQLVVTVVAPDSYNIEGSTETLQRALLTDLMEAIPHCQFPSIRRFDGCPGEEEAGISWPELPLYSEVTRPCPCGTIDLQQGVLRSCEGNFLVGGSWSVPDISTCGFSPVSPRLCDISTLPIERQVVLLAEATVQAIVFEPLDITIASLLLEKITADPLEETLQEGVVESYNNLLGANKTIVTSSQLAADSARRLLTGLDDFALSLGPAQFSTPQLELTVDNKSSYVFNSSGNASAMLTAASISVPREVVELSTAPGGVVYYALTSDTLFVYDQLPEGMSLGNSPRVLGDVFISATVGAEVRDLEDPVVITFSLDQEFPVSEALCVFWNGSRPNSHGEWSSEGCALIRISSEGVVECHCNHLTHFGVIFSVGESTGDEVLSGLTYAGIGLSLVCLLVTSLTYTCSPRLRAKPIGRLVINMCVPLGCFYACFLLGILGKYYPDWFCYVTTSLTLYFLLVYLLWTSVDALHIYYKLVRVLDTQIRYFLLKGGIIAWGLPLLITGFGTGLGIPRTEWYSNSTTNSTDPTARFCYPHGLTLGLSLILPFCLVFLFNLILFIVILVSLLKRLRRIRELKGPTINSTGEVKRLLIIAVILWVLFGLGWVFGLLVSVSAADTAIGCTVSVVVQYIFTVCVGLQGVAIFVLHGLRSKEVRAEWKRAITRCRTKHPQLEMTSSSPPISPTDKISKNPVYISTEQLSYDPKNLPASHKVLPVTPVRRSSEMVDPFTEAQILELEFADSVSQSSVGAAELTDITTVPFCEGELGTAIGPRLSYSEHSLL